MDIAIVIVIAIEYGAEEVAKNSDTDADSDTGFSDRDGGQGQEAAAEDRGREQRTSAVCH